MTSSAAPTRSTHPFGARAAVYLLHDAIDNTASTNKRKRYALSDKTHKHTHTNKFKDIVKKRK